TAMSGATRISPVPVTLTRGWGNGAGPGWAKVEATPPASSSEATTDAKTGLMRARFMRAPGLGCGHKLQASCPEMRFAGRRNVAGVTAPRGGAVEGGSKRRTRGTGNTGYAWRRRVFHSSSNSAYLASRAEGYMPLKNFSPMRQPQRPCWYF